LFESGDFGVLDLRPGVKTPANDFTFPHKDGANGRVGRRAARALPGQI
jgi:hypothetical protein